MAPSPRRLQAPTTPFARRAWRTPEPHEARVFPGAARRVGEIAVGGSRGYEERGDWRGEGIFVGFPSWWVRSTSGLEKCQSSLLGLGQWRIEESITVG